LTIECTTLDNGLRVVSHTMPHLGTVSLGMWVGVGARDEPKRLNGICHLLEHMAFKGTKKRTARAIAEEIEMVGGDLNAATSPEMTAYYVRVLQSDVELALEILSDILQHSRFEPDELALEKEVVLQEIAGIQDMPDELAYDLIHEIAFPDQGLGRPVIGTPATVTALGADELRKYLNNEYSAPRMVLSAAGAIEHNRLVRLAGALFGGLCSHSVPAGETARFVGGTCASQKEFEQTHLLVGFASPAVGHDDFYAAQVFSGLIGGGMSSRLFQTAREERGLCYSIYASAWGLKDCGMFNVHAATGMEMVGELSKVIAAEFEDCAQGGVGERELARAKAQIKAGILMSLESSAARAEQMARQLLSLGRLISADEVIARVEAQTVESMTAFARRLMTSNKIAVSVVGAGPRSVELADELRGRLVG
jgi:predicted Zn-dependent peptidase